MRFTNVAAVLALSVTLVGPLAAQNYSDGWNAYHVGDYSTALKNFAPLAEQGNTDAQFFLGMIYDYGLGVIQDYAEAVKWYREAAEQEHASAQTSLGFMYSQGFGVPVDESEAFRWFKKAAELGGAHAQHNLGTFYQDGRVVSQDNVLAHMWYNIANANGEELGASNRDKVAREMASDQIADAQARARVCMSSDYQDCGLPD